jgi:hypothetical protein
MNDESNKVKNYTKLIGRYLNISKPNGVLEIKFELTPVGDENEYYMKITYVVPDDSKYLKVNDKNLIPVRYRHEWNYQITKDLENYFGLKVYINQSGTRNENFYNR